VPREAGFVSVAVTGKSGDGGVDGIAPTASRRSGFPVFSQCKRYAGSVGAGAVRGFRGAISGRGEKGLPITTGTFTLEAPLGGTAHGS
jgi:restriction system protein